MLFSVESGIVKRLDNIALNGFRVEIFLDGLTVFEVLFNDFGDMVGLHLGVERALGVNYHNRTECAKTEAACLDDVNLALKTVLFEFFLELFDDFHRTGRGAARTAAHQNVLNAVVLALDACCDNFRSRSLDSVKLVNCFNYVH